MLKEDRVIFFKGKQKDFINEIKRISRLNWKELALATKFGYHRIRHELRNEVYSLSYEDFTKLCEIAKVNSNFYHPHIKEFRNKNWGQKLAGMITGNKNRGRIKLEINYPNLDSRLAEFVGIVLGDGSISKTKYDINIILNKNTDKFYSKYVLSLFKELFELTPVIREKNNTLSIRVYSIALFNFLKELGMPYGTMEKYVPECILIKKDLKYACIRGLFDTDGSISLSNKWCVLNFTSSSKHLYNTFLETLKEMGIKAVKSGTNINLTSLWKIRKFYSVIGSSNLKNVIKYIEYTKNHESIKSSDTPKFYKIYENTNLPFIEGP